MTAELVYTPPGPLDLARSLGVLCHGRRDPVTRIERLAGRAPGVRVWRAVQTPAGPGLLRLDAPAERIAVRACAWGPGAQWLLATVPALLGAADDRTGFQPRHPVLVRLVRTYPGVVLPRTGLVLDALVPAVLEQKVTGTEAHRSWLALISRFGAPPPGPAPVGMAVPPDPPGWLAVPSWEWHRAGVDAKRARAIRAAAAVADSLERLVCCPEPTVALAALVSVAGVGPWTAAETAQRAFGDPDALSVGDFHLPSTVGWVLAGRVRTDDAGMLDLLADYRPQRQRVVRYVELAGLTAARFGPRAAVRSYRAI